MEPELGAMRLRAGLSYGPEAGPPPALLAATLRDCTDISRRVEPILASVAAGDLPAAQGVEEVCGALDPR